MKNKFYTAISSSALLFTSFLFFICALQSSAQKLSTNEDGTITKNKGSLTITIDEFTGEIGMFVADTLRLSNFYEEELENQRSFVMPMFVGRESNLKENYGGDKIFGLSVINIGYDTYLGDEMGNVPVLYLIDGERNSTEALYFSAEEQDSNFEMAMIKFSQREWERIIESDKTRLRIRNQVFSIDKNTRDIMIEVYDEFIALKSDFKKNDESLENEIPEKENRAPYELNWEGDLERAPLVQPLPENTSDVEATITIRFEVKPNGKVGRIIPLGERNPELEREVTRTLRSWRFSRLPSGVPQQSQWGTLTFRFISK